MKKKIKIKPSTQYEKVTLRTLIIRSFVLDSNKCSKVLVSSGTSGRSSQMNPPTFDRIGTGVGFSWISRQKSFTVFLFFLIVELSESFDNSVAYTGGGGTLFLCTEGKPGKGGGLHTAGRNIPGGGGGGPVDAFTLWDNVSSSESWRKSEKSRSHRWYSRLRHLCLNSSQWSSFSDILISWTLGDFSTLGLFMTSVKKLRKQRHSLVKWNVLT